MDKICSVVGARPQFIKAAPLSREIRKKFKEVLIHTGQHYDQEMSQLFFDELEIPKPDYNLGVGSGLHGEQTAKMLSALEKLFLKEKPKLVVVFGDTNSTLAGALAASKLHIPVVHVEAGMRSFNLNMPEEINRTVADHLSTILFCSTKSSVEWLRKEGINKGVHLVGDIMLEAFLNNLKIAQKKSTILKKLKINKKSYYLTTIHRAENTDNKKNIKEVIEALESCQKTIIFPVHPRTIKNLKKFNLLKVLKKNKNIKIIKPVGYLNMLVLEKNTKVILTDSGGIQKEAYFLKVQCVTLREETEWVETLAGHWNQIVGADEKKIIRALQKRPNRKTYRNFFGDGNMAKKITDVLYEYCSK